MPVQDLHVFGPALVRIATAGGSYADLGYTVEGVDIATRIFIEDVPTDRQGPMMPTDAQYMGQEASISLPMASWDVTVMNTVKAGIKNGTLGTVAAANIGTLYLAAQLYFGVQIVPTARTGQGITGFPTQSTYTFPVCNLVDQIALRVGTRVTRTTFVMRAFVNPATGVLYTLS